MHLHVFLKNILYRGGTMPWDGRCFEPTELSTSVRGLWAAMAYGYTGDEANKGLLPNNAMLYNHLWKQQ